MKQNIIPTIKNVLIFIAILWGIWLIDSIFPVHLSTYGIEPRKISGLIGVLLAPFIHGSFYHILSNTLPLFVLTTVLFLFYNKKAPYVILFSILIGGILVWTFGRSAHHIGASGLIYSLAAFLICSGILKREFISILISIVIILLYGGLVWGILPTKSWISWEGHLFGAVAGILISYYFFKKRKK